MNTNAPTAASLPSFKGIMDDLSALHAASISLSQSLSKSGALDQDTTTNTAETQSSLEKLEKFKSSTEKSQRAEGVVENGFEVASDFLRMNKELSVAKLEMETLQERMSGLEKELTEVRELIAFNPIK
ncbi:hypothetical protein BG011_003686 [Mortierella polycephala]|uniref:Uncharacterized protein n=1 Tax=Mortierella polycephala TaxID=41804 RepID=A0A9P6Q0D2_9FUNG|nr:hypothetical protein BG011_003686 [Mortierella polycephala]